MRRAFFFVALPLILAGCAQIFDANLFEGVDALPPLDSGALKNASVADIKSQMADDSFYDRLKKDPAALDNLQAGLADKFNTLDAESTDVEKTAVVDAATTFVLVTANSTSVAEIKQNLGNNLPDLQNALSPPADPVTGVAPAADYGKAFDAIVGNKSDAEVAQTLSDLVAMAGAMSKMQEASQTTTDGTTTVSSSVFLPETTDAASFAQLVLMAAAADAVTKEYGGDTAAAAAAIAAGTVTPSTGGALELFASALNGTDKDPKTNQYAYLNVVTGTLPIKFDK